MLFVIIYTIPWYLVNSPQHGFCIHLNKSQLRSGGGALWTTTYPKSSRAYKRILPWRLFLHIVCTWNWPRTVSLSVCRDRWSYKLIWTWNFGFKQTPKVF